MVDKKRPNRVALFSMAIAMASVAMAAQFGCAIQDCDEVEGEYQQALSQESALVSLEEDGPPHLAMAIRLDFLNELSSGLIDRAIGDAIGTGGSMRVLGEDVDFGIGSTGAGLQIEASDACNGCLRVFGDFDGDVQVDMPWVGERSSPLSGTMDWVVPLDVGRDGDEVGVFLDTPKAVEMGLPSIEGRLPAISEDWEEYVMRSLSEQISTSIADNLEPLRLTGYKMPELGLSGIELTPSLFSLDGASNSLVLGLRTNTDAAVGEGTDEDFINALSLEDGQNIALGVQPGFVTEAVRLALHQNEVPRRYALSGHARQDGSAHAVVDGFDVRPHQSVSDAVGLGLDFRVFNIQSSLGCFGADGLATSRLQIADGEMALDVENVEFSGPGSLVDAANWASAEFVEHTQGVLRSSMDDDVLSSSEFGINLRGDRVSTEAGMLVLRAIGTPD